MQGGEGGEGGGGGGFLLRRDGGTSKTGCQRRSARAGCLLVARGGELLVTHLARSYSPLYGASSSSLSPQIEGAEERLKRRAFDLFGLVAHRFGYW